MDGVYGDTISKELAYSMSMMLDCVDNENMDTCSIHLVPEKLRKSKVEAYKPQVVSIGPLHQGKRMELQHMEKIKWRCLLHLLNRASVGADEALKKCGSAMLKLDKVVRASYSVDKLEFDSSDLAKCMVLDGCFLLELLISGSTELDNKINNTSSDSSPGGHVIRGGKVLSDLTLLENQIPLVVLELLSSKLFPHVFGGYGDTHGDILIQQLALSILGYDYASLGSRCGKLNVYNFLELVHAFIDNEKGGTKRDVKIPIDSGEDESNRRLKLNRCANELLVAGVTIKGKINAQMEDSNIAAMNRFDMRITFSDGKLEIPQLRITETTEAKWRNFIAWEVNKNKVEKYNGERALSEDMSEARTRFHFLYYAWFFQSLICSVDDVKLLLDREVIWVAVDKKGRRIKSNEDLVDLFCKMSEGVSESDVEETDMDPWISEVILQLNSYRSTLCTTATFRIMWHVLKGSLTLFCYNWMRSFRLLRRDYIPTRWKLIAVIAAAAGVILTAAQTFFSARGD